MRRLTGKADQAVVAEMSRRHQAAMARGQEIPSRARHGAAREEQDSPEDDAGTAAPAPAPALRGRRDVPAPPRVRGNPLHADGPEDENSDGGDGGGSGDEEEEEEEDKIGFRRKKLKAVAQGKAAQAPSISTRAAGASLPPQSGSRNRAQPNPGVSRRTGALTHPLGLLVRRVAPPRSRIGQPAHGHDGRLQRRGRDPARTCKVR